MENEDIEGGCEGCGEDNSKQDKIDIKSFILFVCSVLDQR